MLLKFLKRPLPLVLIAITAISVAIWSQTFFNPNTQLIQFNVSSTPLHKLINSFAGVNSYIQAFLAFTIIYITAMVLIQLSSKHILIKSRSYLPALFFVVFSSAYRPLQQFDPAIVSALLLVFALDRIFASYDKFEPVNNLYQAAFLVALASLFYSPSAFYVLLIFISAAIFRPFNLRHLLSIVLGFLTPWFFLVFYEYYTSTSFSFLYYLKTLIALEGSIHTIGITFYVFFGLMSLIVLIGIAHLIGSLSTQKISIRKFHSIFLWFILISISLIAILPWGSTEIIYLAAIPVSFLLSNLFINLRNRFWGELLVTLMLLTTVVIQFV